MAEEITIQIKSTKQTPEITRHDFLAPLMPEVIEWQPVFEGVEIDVLDSARNIVLADFTAASISDRIDANETTSTNDD